LLSRFWRRLTAKSRFASEIETASLADIASAHLLLFGRTIPPETEASYVARLAHRPLRFEELAEEMLHSPEFTARFGRLSHSTDDDIVEATVDGVAIFLRRSDVLISGPVLAGHPHEPQVWATLAPLLLPGTTFVDVGANVGLFALPAARRVGPSGRVIAVEPLAENVQLLCAAAARNRFDNLEVMPFAASDHSGVVAVVSRQETTNSFTPPDRAVRPGAPCAPCAPLDALLGSRGRIDLVKVDVEGYEPAVFAGSRDLLARDRPTLLVEFNPFGLDANFGQDPRRLADWLLDYADDVTVIVRDAAPIRCIRGAEILRAWEAVNARLGLDGRLHVDVLAKARIRPGADRGARPGRHDP
jgi:FkbM family methyltransferase